MGSDEIFEGVSDGEEKVIEEVVELVKKPKKGRPPMTEERKEQLRQQLKRGRETSLANRQKKALVRKADKAEKEKVDNAKIAKHILGKDLQSNHYEIEKLKLELAELKKAKASAPPPEPKAEPKAEVKETPPPANVKQEAPKPAPVKQTIPPAPKVFNTKTARKRRMF
ncbi:MAG: hypothetical protein ACR2M9_02990 [Cyanophyceae cyanobacterium]